MVLGGNSEKVTWCVFFDWVWQGGAASGGGNGGKGDFPVVPASFQLEDRDKEDFWSSHEVPDVSQL